jgi:hypothetical protein
MRAKAAKRKPAKRKSPVIAAIKALNRRLNDIEDQIMILQSKPLFAAPYPVMDTEQLMLFVRLEQLLTHPEFQDFIRSRLPAETKPIDVNESHG